MLEISELCRYFDYIKSMKIETLIEMLQRYQKIKPGVEVVYETGKCMVNTVEKAALIQRQVRPIEKDNCALMLCH